MQIFGRRLRVYLFSLTLGVVAMSLYYLRVIRPTQVRYWVEYEASDVNVMKVHINCPLVPEVPQESRQILGVSGASAGTYLLIINRGADGDWNEIKPRILEVIKKHLVRENERLIEERAPKDPFKPQPTTGPTANLARSARASPKGAPRKFISNLLKDFSTYTTIVA